MTFRLMYGRNFHSKIVSSQHKEPLIALRWSAICRWSFMAELLQDHRDFSRINYTYWICAPNLSGKSLKLTLKTKPLLANDMAIQWSIINLT